MSISGASLKLYSVNKQTSSVPSANFNFKTDNNMNHHLGPCFLTFLDSNALSLPPSLLDQYPQTIHPLIMSHWDQISKSIPETLAKGQDSDKRVRVADVEQKTVL